MQSRAGFFRPFVTAMISAQRVAGGVVLAVRGGVAEPARLVLAARLVDLAGAFAFALLRTLAVAACAPRLRGPAARRV